MSVTENVFHSLIVGHCRADDFENAKGVLTIMKDSGVDVGPDSRMIYALELARAGKEYKKELEGVGVRGAAENYEGVGQRTMKRWGYRRGQRSMKEWG